MKTNKSAPKYGNVKNVVRQGFRRVSKSELKALGYSTKSALYTKQGVTHPSKFLTRADIRKVQEPLKEKELFESFHFSQIKRERIQATRRKLFRHTHAVYSDYLKPVTLQQAITLTEKFFEFLEKRYNPTWRNQIGMIYKGIDDDFSLQPRLWRDRYKLIIDKLQSMLKKYKAKMQIVFIIGWIEQSKWWKNKMRIKVKAVINETFEFEMNVPNAETWEIVKLAQQEADEQSNNQVFVTRLVYIIDDTRNEVIAGQRLW